MLMRKLLKLLKPVTYGNLLQQNSISKTEKDLKNDG